MSLFLYLDEKFQKSRDCKAIQKNEKGGGEHTEYHLYGEYVFHDEGGWYIMASSSLEEVPNTFKDLVIGVSLLEDFPIQPKRERGIYRHESVTAELETGNRGGKDMKHLVVIKGEKLADARELLRRIKAGSIRPEISYDGPQSGLSRAEIEDALRVANTEILRLIRDLKTSQGNLLWSNGKLKAVLSLGDQIAESKWPICTKKRVVQGIRELVQI